MESRWHQHHITVDITHSETLLALQHPHRHIDVYGLNASDAICLRYDISWRCSSDADRHHIRLLPKSSYNHICTIAQAFHTRIATSPSSIFNFPFSSIAMPNHPPTDCSWRHILRSPSFPCRARSLPPIR